MVPMVPSVLYHSPDSLGSLDPSIPWVPHDYLSFHSSLSSYGSSNSYGSPSSDSSFDSLSSLGSVSSMVPSVLWVP